MNNLFGDVEAGRRAEELLLQLEPYFTIVETDLLRAFKECSIRDHDGLMVIKLQHKALEALRMNIQSVMTTGKLADVEISQRNK